MGVRFHDQPLERQLNNVEYQIAGLAARLERADGKERLSLVRQIAELEGQRRDMESRLRALVEEPLGIMRTLRANYRRLGDEFAAGFEKWLQHLDEHEAERLARRGPVC